MVTTWVRECCGGSPWSSASLVWSGVKVRSRTDGLETFLERVVLQEIRGDLRVTMAGGPFSSFSCWCSLTVVSTVSTVSSNDAWLRHLLVASVAIPAPVGGASDSYVVVALQVLSGLMVQAASTMVRGLRFVASGPE